MIPHTATQSRSCLGLPGCVLLNSSLQKSLLMNPLTAINAIANFIVAASVLDMSFRVFGRPEHPIHKSPWMLAFRKLVSSVVICGAVLNLATLSTPTWTEVFLNIGFSLNYIWSSIYDRSSSCKHPQESSVLPGKRSSGRSSNSRKAEPCTATSFRRRPGSTK